MTRTKDDTALANKIAQSEASCFMLDQKQKNLVVGALRAMSQTPDAMREALQVVADFMREDVKSGDSNLWTPEYEELHDQVIVALSTPSASAGPQAEAVAWRFRWQDSNGWETVSDESALPTNRDGLEIEPLYAQPRPHQAEGRGAVIEALPKPETMLTYASILEKPKYQIDEKTGIKYRLATGEIVEAACAALRYCAALRQSHETDNA
jgi:hypothetical protein